MKKFRILSLALFGVIAGCGKSDAETRHSAAAKVLAPPRDSVARTPKVPVFPHVARPDTLRGLYINRWAALGEKMPRLIRVAKRTEVNAFVIDVKDDRGFVLYRSSVPLARAIGADTNHTMSAARVRLPPDTSSARSISLPSASSTFSEVRTTALSPPAVAPGCLPLPLPLAG